MSASCTSRSIPKVSHNSFHKLTNGPSRKHPTVFNQYFEIRRPFTNTQPPHPPPPNRSPNPATSPPYKLDTTSSTESPISFTPFHLTRDAHRDSRVRLSNLQNSHTYHHPFLTHWDQTHLLTLSGSLKPPIDLITPRMGFPTSTRPRWQTYHIPFQRNCVITTPPVSSGPAKCHTARASLPRRHDVRIL